MTYLLRDYSSQEELQALAQKAHDGDIEALARVLHVCSVLEMPIPQPLARRLAVGAELWLNGEKDFAHFLGFVRKPGEKKSGARKRRALRKEVWFEFLDLYKGAGYGGKLTKDAAMVAIAVKHGVDQSTVKNYLKPYKQALQDLRR